MNTSNRRKVCELEIQKQAYLRHISRLEELKDGRSPEQVKRNREQKKIVEAINTVRKMHTFNRVFKQREMKQIQQQSKDVDFSKIKSVVTVDFNRPVPLIAPKHKRNEQPIVDQNLKIFKRILNTKPNLNFKEQCLTERKVKPTLPSITSLDFSKLYETSKLSNNEFSIIKLKFTSGGGKSGKGKFMKAKISINLQELFEHIKDVNAMYFIEGNFLGCKARTSNFILGELAFMRIIAKISTKLMEDCQSKTKIVLKIFKIIDGYDKKQICKAKLCANIHISDLKQSKEYQPAYDSCQQNSINQVCSPRSTMRNCQLLKQRDLPIIRLQLQRQQKFGSTCSQQQQRQQSLERNQNKGDNFVHYR